VLLALQKDSACLFINITRNLTVSLFVLRPMAAAITAMFVGATPWEGSLTG
jgi:hypothetical protein